MKKTLQIPPTLRGSSILAFTSSFWEIKENEIEFDFSRLNFAFPFATLVLASEIQSLIQKFPDKSYSAIGINSDISAHSYLKHVGFYQHTGINVGNPPGFSGGQSYVPITVITRDMIKLRSTGNSNPFGSSIQLEAEHLAKVTTGSYQIKVYKPIAYCIREIIRNVFEHAEVDACVISAQQYVNEVEIAIVDRGCGIRTSLSNRFNHQSDEEALLDAIKPGVSKSDFSKDDANEWANSGFGLFVLSELGRRTGTFCLCSGESVIKLSRGKGLEIKHSPFHGTAVRLRIEKPKGVNYIQFIEEIIREGEKISAQSSFPSRASKSTKMIW